jgi:alpha-L-rhamnosidase
MILRCALALAVSLQASAVTPIDLKVDGKTDPLAAPDAPRLSWRIESDQRGTRQTAWQILAASKPELLEEGKADLWDSGRTATERSPFVRYAGKAPEPGQPCHWKVRVWSGAEEPSEWSAPAFWERAPDWKNAKWIDDGKPNPEKDEDFYKADPAPLLRKEFVLEKPAVRARLHIAGLGIGIPSLNGTRVGDEPLGPPWTNFEKRVLYSTFDVTKQLSEGANCLGITLGNGWYNPLPLRFWGHRNIRESLPVGRPRGIALLVMEHADGTTTTVATGAGWKVGTGATLMNSIYLGEVRDARLAVSDWDKAGFDDSAWKSARVTEDKVDVLRPIETPPVRTLAPIPAVAVTTPKPGIHIVDFGANFTGVPEIRINAPAGTTVLFRYGELLNADGTVNYLTSVAGQIKGKKKDSDESVGGPGAPDIAWQQDVYIAAGGEETFRPDFTFHAFRYMEIKGLPEAPAAADVRAFPTHSDLPSAGAFSCSNPLLNEIQEMCLRTFLANVVSVQSDCPHRERFGYGGDIAVTSETYLMNFDMAGFYAKTIRDWADAARPDGRLTDTAPFVGIDYCGVGWSMVHPLLLEQLYIHYGDRSLLEEQVPVALKWLETEAAARKDGLVVKGLGDHEALTNSKGPQMTTPMFVDAARRCARLAEIIGNKEAAARCNAMAVESAVAWGEAFYDMETGKAATGSQTEQLFALGFGAVSPEERWKAFEQLVKAVNGADNGPALTTGIFGTRFLMEELSGGGRSDLAYELAVKKTFPSWGWMLENGATTLWEDWQGGDNVKSHNHPMFGSISGWFHRWLGGIQIAPDAVGADRLLIRPQVVDGLGHVKCSHRTIRGLIVSNWTKEEGKTEFEIVIPPDTEALVWLPGAKGSNLKEGGKPVQDADGIDSVDYDPGVNCHRLRLVSGTYRFTVAE